MRFLVSVLLLITLLVVEVSAADPLCRVQSVTVTPAGVGPKPPPAGFFPFTKSQIEGGFSADEIEFLDPLKTTWSCVDARGDGNAILGTPGGDFSEFAAAVYVYLVYYADKSTTERNIAPIFHRYMQDVITYERPFYYHTDFKRINKFFDQFAVANPTLERPVRIPSNLDLSNDTLVELWLDGLTSDHSQGCGHIRLGMRRPLEYKLSDGGAVLKNLLKVFYKSYWAVPKNSLSKHKYSIQVKGGDLSGRAILILNNTGPACTYLAPAAYPNSRAASVFVYNGQAVSEFRRKVVAPFFQKYDPRINAEKFFGDYNQLANDQLGATLRLLDGANSLPLYKVDVTTKISVGRNRP